MKTAQPRFIPQVFVYRDDDNARYVALVFRKGRTLYHAIVAKRSAITLETFPTLRGFDPLPVGLANCDGIYQPRKAASFWLNHDHRPIAKRARAVLKGLVARQPKAGLTTAPAGLTVKVDSQPTKGA
jgi:hypothetical protein